MPLGPRSARHADRSATQRYKGPSVDDYRTRQRVVVDYAEVLVEHSITTKEAAERLGVTKQMLWRMRRKGEGPA